MRNDNVKIISGIATIERWAQVELDSDIFTPADAFVFRGPVPENSIIREQLNDGNKVSIMIGNDRQMAGVIDTVEYCLERGKSSFAVAGRDRAAFLIDSEVGKKSGKDEAISAKGMTIKALAEYLIKPSFGIGAVVLSNAQNRRVLQGKRGQKIDLRGLREARFDAVRGAPSQPIFAIPPRQKTKLDAGRTRASILDEHTRRLGLIWWLAADGRLFIGKPNYSQPPSYRFRVPKPSTNPSNVESCTFTREVSDRYSEITVYAQGRGGNGGFLSATDPSGAKIKATVIDPELVARGIDRKLIIADNDVLNTDQALRRANFEMGIRKMRGFRVNLVVPEFGQNGRRYAVDTTADLTIEELGMHGIFYIVQRRFVEERGRRRTHLTLHKPRVFLA